MPTNTNKRYSPEFKAEAVQRAREVGVYKVCKELGISNSSMYKWIATARYKPGTKDAPIALEKPNPFELTEEIKQLKKELARVKEEREILKKATAFFARHEK